jgi:hypothetical protein
MTYEKCVWPSGEDKPVCLIKHDQDVFFYKTGLRLSAGVDDLDEYFGHFFIDKEIGPIKLICYPNAPVSGISVYVDSMVKTLVAIEVIKNRFCFDESDFSWISEVD